RYALADIPTCTSSSRSDGLVFSAPDTAPASVPSSPSSTHVMPSATITSVWKRAQGKASSRAGTVLSTIVPAGGGARFISTLGVGRMVLREHLESWAAT